MPPLTDRTLASLHPEVAVPTYDRSSLTTGVVHVGVGGFHRAHGAMYLDRLLGQAWTRRGPWPGWGRCPRTAPCSRPSS